MHHNCCFGKMTTTVKFLTLLSLAFYMLGTFSLSLSLRPVLRRLTQALAELEESVDALRDRSPSMANAHLGQVVKMQRPEKLAGEFNTFGFWLTGIGALLQVTALLL